MEGKYRRAIALSSKFQEVVGGVQDEGRSVIITVEVGMGDRCGFTITRRCNGLKRRSVGVKVWDSR
ncbi:MAG: hypothetical protein IGR76_05040 [Synechococcales cyanobacterium T60_A2020_003]|nr:hypothetical protein [Synechococcales cyanobacterium T60_A2020_003]